MRRRIKGRTYCNRICYALLPPEKDFSQDRIRGKVVLTCIYDGTAGNCPWYPTTKVLYEFLPAMGEMDFRDLIKLAFCKKVIHSTSDGGSRSNTEPCTQKCSVYSAEWWIYNSLSFFKCKSERIKFTLFNTKSALCITLVNNYQVATGLQ